VELAPEKQSPVPREQYPLPGEGLTEHVERRPFVVAPPQCVEAEETEDAGEPAEVEVEEESRLAVQPQGLLEREELRERAVRRGQVEGPGRAVDERRADLEPWNAEALREVPEALVGPKAQLNAALRHARPGAAAQKKAKPSAGGQFRPTGRELLFVLERHGDSIAPSCQRQQKRGLHMETRTLGKTGFSVSEIGLGTWQVGGRWGERFDHALADRVIGAAVDGGVTFIDTADVYSDGESEKAVGRALKARRGQLHFATKCGRQISPHVNSGYTPERLRSFVEESLGRLGVDCLDLIQLHCPPTEVFYRPEIFELFVRLKEEGKIRNLGVSVEKVEEALKAIEFPNVATVQIIFNMFRRRPAELFFKEAARRNIGVIVRVPLASGLLSGRFTAQTSFGARDHRSFNRQGAEFDRGETFSGVDYGRGLEAVGALKKALPTEPGLAAWALRWILMFDAVSVVIPGASRPEQIAENLKASELRPLKPEEMAAVADVYERYIKDPVHYLW